MSVVYSKITASGQTTIPHEIRNRLGLKPGDRVRYTDSKTGVLMEKAGHLVEVDPFAVFTEWSGAADEKAYGRL